MQPLPRSGGPSTRGCCSPWARADCSDHRNRWKTFLEFGLDPKRKRQAMRNLYNPAQQHLPFLPVPGELGRGRCPWPVPPSPPRARCWGELGSSLIPQQRGGLGSPWGFRGSSWRAGSPGGAFWGCFRRAACGQRAAGKGPCCWRFVPDHVRQELVTLGCSRATQVGGGVCLPRKRRFRIRDSCPSTPTALGRGKGAGGGAPWGSPTAGLAWDQPRLPLPGGCQEEEEEESGAVPVSPSPSCPPPLC